MNVEHSYTSLGAKVSTNWNKYPEKMMLSCSSYVQSLKVPNNNDTPINLKLPAQIKAGG